MYEARYWGILSAYAIRHVQAGLIHVICLGISVAVPRQDSLFSYRAHAVLDVCDYIGCSMSLAEEASPPSCLNVGFVYCCDPHCCTALHTLWAGLG